MDPTERVEVWLDALVRVWAAMRDPPKKPPPSVPVGELGGVEAIQNALDELSPEWVSQAVERRVIDGVAFNGIGMERLDFAGWVFRNCRFSLCRFDGSSFVSTRLENVRFDRCRLVGVDPPRRSAPVSRRQRSRTRPGSTRRPRRPCFAEPS